MNYPVPSLLLVTFLTVLYCVLFTSPQRIKKGVTPQVVPRKIQEGTPTSEESVTMDNPITSVQVLLRPEKV